MCIDVCIAVCIDVCIDTCIDMSIDGLFYRIRDVFETHQRDWSRLDIFFSLSLYRPNCTTAHTAITYQL